MNHASTCQWIPADTLQAWRWDRGMLRQWQLQQLNQQLQAVLPTNRFYQRKFGTDSLQLSSLEQLSELPITEKQELVQSASESEYGISAHHSFDRYRYSRVHRTSGTTGQPLMILDTAEDWLWWSSAWQHVLQAAAVVPEDRVFMAFSFGPFIGFWSAHQACIDRGALVIPGGGLTSLARLEFIRQSQANVVCCTPSYALHLADVAAAENIPLPALKIERMIVAGEAGGSVPGVRNKIESAWGARVIDHSGATEIGPWGFGWPDRCGLHLIETNFIAEFLPLARGPGEHNPRSTDLAELVITSLGRYGAPIFRYRTGDVVRHEYINDERVGCNFVWLPDGVVGRADDMVTIRGVNVFPSSIDAIVREVPGISEYRIIVSRRGELDQLQVEIEADEATQHQLEKNLASRLGLRIPVALAPLASLPRSELKSRRWIDQRFND